MGVDNRIGACRIYPAAGALDLAHDEGDHPTTEIVSGLRVPRAAWGHRQDILLRGARQAERA